LFECILTGIALGCQIIQLDLGAYRPDPTLVPASAPKKPMVSLRDLSALSASAVISLAGNSNIFMHLGAPPAHERLTQSVFETPHKIILSSSISGFSVCFRAHNPSGHAATLKISPKTALSLPLPKYFLQISHAFFITSLFVSTYCFRGSRPLETSNVNSRPAGRALQPEKSC
jgi:hypothetical protein